MKKNQKHIEIIRTTADGFMTMSPETCSEIFRILSKHYREVYVRIVNGIADIDALIASKPDLVFIGMKRLPYNGSIKATETFWVSEYLELHGIEHTGSPAAAMKLERDKSRAKQRMLDAGLPTPKYIVKRRGELFNAANLNLQFPLFIKPSSFGESIGIDENSVVHTIEALQSKVANLKQQFDTDILIEEYLPGREFSVSMLRIEGSNNYATLPLELIAPVDQDGLRILSNRVKKLDIEVSRLVTDKTLCATICDLALSAFRALGAQDYGRIDIRLDAFGKPSFLEANLLPSLKPNPGNYFPKACLLNSGLDHEAIILSIVGLGLSRATIDDENINKTITFPGAGQRLVAQT